MSTRGASIAPLSRCRRWSRRSPREQIATNRPQGITQVFESLQTKTGDRHTAEHQALDCLAEALWTAQNNNTAPDEQAYLESLRRLAG
jgi:hypothetical protein